MRSSGVWVSVGGGGGVNCWYSNSVTVCWQQWIDLESLLIHIVATVVLSIYFCFFDEYLCIASDMAVFIK